MTITLYHGTDRVFDRFEIRKDLAKTDITSLAEGYGIYFSLSESFAKSYGNIIYVVEVTEDDYTDFTKEKEIKKLIATIEKGVGIPIRKYIDGDSIVEGILAGDLSVLKLYKELTDWLDSQYEFYEKYGNLVTYEDDCLFKKIEDLFFANIKDIARYYDKDFNADIFICHRNPEKLKPKRIVCE